MLVLVEIKIGLVLIWVCVFRIFCCVFLVFFERDLSVVMFVEKEFSN